MTYARSGRLFALLTTLVATFFMAAAGCGPARQSTGDHDASGDGQVSDAQQVDAFWTDPYVDDDGDGYNEVQGDCDDLDNTVYPTAEEICDDGKDNNCNNYVDASEPDEDQDGWGPCRGDCDEGDPDVNPGMNELPANGKDDDCDGITDADFDSDGWTEADGDCNDSDPDVHPDAIEYCFDTIDNDCDGFADANEPDSDGDGYGPCQGDCDDTNGQVHPGQPEIDGDGIDNNCDFLIDEDIDGDGWTAANGDCDDGNVNINPSIPEDCNDGVDNNCDGATDTDCLSPCELAELTNSYIGCEYWAASTMNTMLAANFNNNYALVVHNANATAANVTVSKNGAPVASQIVNPDQVYVFLLAYDQTLKNTNNNDITVAGGAYHLVSDFPVTVYQFNPFDYHLGGANYSYSNDASLVLPAHVLSNNYMITTRPTFWDSSPGFFAVIGTTNGTTVEITFTANVWGGPNIGSTTTYNLNEGDVLQVPSRNCSSGSYAFCSAAYDLTGTRIRVTAGGPVAVFAGHDCLYLPPNLGFCDHIEEQMFPLESWGVSYVAAHTDYAPVNQYRVLSGADNNTIVFTPASVQAQVNLNEGGYVDFQTGVDFSVECTEACLVSQFILADDFFPAEDSDPAMGLLVPSEQFRDSYSFTVPSSMTRNYVTVLKRVGANPPTVTMDGAPIPEASFGGAIGSSVYGAARINISSAPFDHSMTSTEPFGIMVYGFASYTSYLYPGGLDLEFINPVN